MVKTSITTLDFEKVQTVVNYFKVNVRGTAEQIGVSGSLMKSLCDRGLFRVCEKKTAFVKINPYEEIYRKVEVNIYENVYPIETIIGHYTSECKKQATIKKERAREVIDGAKTLLDMADELLARCL